MTNGAHQGSVLGPLLFVIWIKDLDVNVNGLVSKFVDDAKIGGVVNSEEYCQKKRWDIDHLQEWAEKWQVAFKPSKYEV